MSHILELLLTSMDKIINNRIFEDAFCSVKKNKLQKSLKSCGKNLFVDFPIVIHEPQHVEIGDDAALGAFVLIWGGGGLTIGDRVMIAAGAKISTQTHDINNPRPRWTNKNDRVIIGNDAWIGLNAVVLPGVEIKEGAVVGAGAVVTRDVEPYNVVVGVPAKPIRVRAAKGRDGSQLIN